MCRLSHIGGLPIAVIDRAKSAQLLIDLSLSRRDSALPPLIVTSANGQVLSLCARRPEIRDLFLQSDLIHADGMSLVFASHIFCERSLPERICTTDFFHDVASVGQRQRARMYLLGGTERVIHEAARHVRSAYPDTQHCRSSEWIYAPQRTKNPASLTPSMPPDPTFFGSVLAPRLSKSSPCAIVIGCAASV